jgi:hypothetical protein
VISNSYIGRVFGIRCCTARIRLEDAGLRIAGTRMAASNAGARWEVTFDLREYRLPDDPTTGGV